MVEWRDDPLLLLVPSPSVPSWGSELLLRQQAGSVVKKIQPNMQALVNKAEKATAEIGVRVQSAFGAPSPPRSRGGSRPLQQLPDAPAPTHLLLTVLTTNLPKTPVGDDNQVPESVLRRGDAAVVAYQVRSQESRWLLTIPAGFALKARGHGCSVRCPPLPGSPLRRSALRRRQPVRPRRGRLKRTSR